MNFQRARDIVSQKQVNKPTQKQTQMATVKFVSASSRYSSAHRQKTSISSLISSSTSSSTSSSISSSSAPVRHIVQDAPMRKRNHKTSQNIVGIFIRFII